jgi:NhaA family Na+:H+ antiporter
MNSKNSPQKNHLDFVKDFMKYEPVSGLTMIFFASLAILMANSGFSESYFAFTKNEISLSFGGDTIYSAQLKEWVKNLFMAIFFLLVGLEIRQEFSHGSLSEPKKAILPLIAAAGGMVIPALIYFALNYSNPETAHGWAIPSATDIAFALCVLAIAGRGLNPALRAFLLAIAVIDDIGAILIIALFYGGDINGAWFGTSFALIMLISTLCWLGLRNLGVYFFIGCLLWITLLKTGISPTIAGVVLGLLIPVNKIGGESESPSEKFAHILHPWVNFMILPIFAFTASGVDLSHFSLKYLLEPVTLGVALGLFIGKQIGIFGSTFVAVKSGIGLKPQGSNWLEIYGVSVVCGIGFTMSLFVTILAFDTDLLRDEAKIGVIIGSLLSTIWAVIIFKVCRMRRD